MRKYAGIWQSNDTRSKGAHLGRIPFLSLRMDGVLPINIFARGSSRD